MKAFVLGSVYVLANYPHLFWQQAANQVRKLIQKEIKILKLHQISYLHCLSSSMKPFPRRGLK